MADAQLQQTPFVKQLAANDRPTRDKAVASLRTYLTSRQTFSRIEMLKLWRGLFYCMWMSDRPRPQQALANDLADLVMHMSTQNAVVFLQAYWETMAREWPNIDVLRMDKFLLLVRRYQAASFRYLLSQKWDDSLTQQFMEILEDVPLSPTEKKVTNGLRFHIADIYVDELEKIIPEGAGNGLPLQLLFRPFENLAANGPTKLVRKRAKEVLGDERLSTWEYRCMASSLGNQSSAGGGDQDEWTGFDD